MTSFTRCWRSFRVRSLIRFHDVILMFDVKLLSCVHILFVVSPYPVDLVGHIGRNKAMQQYLVVESLCVPHSVNGRHDRLLLSCIRITMGGIYSAFIAGGWVSIAFGSDLTHSSLSVRVHLTTHLSLSICFFSNQLFYTIFLPSRSVTNKSTLYHLTCIYSKLFNISAWELPYIV